ncbi:uncharacterized protein RJT20DRAFT_46497 [Scheffersomyces xylosifermentans]|uniref:uncharacterized protein n=1 Tax=Scheffersomyces xylosifermentans TaxID=1304137 RepID=UPI00315DA6E0
MSAVSKYLEYYQEKSHFFYSIVPLVVTTLSLFAIKKLLFIRGAKRYSNKFLHGAILVIIFILNANLWYYIVTSIVDVHLQYKLNTSPTFNLLHSPVTDSIANLNFTEFKMPGYSFLEMGMDELNDFDCGKIRFLDESNVKASDAHSIDQSRDLKMIRDQALRMNETGEFPIIRKCFFDKDYEKERDILKMKWFKFNGASAWLDHFEVYFVVSRVSYSRMKRRNRPVISLVYAQVFDKDWNEILDYKFPNSELSFPSILPIQTDEHPEGQNVFLGADDPRLTLRTVVDPETKIAYQEPVVIFNAYVAELGWKRAIHTYRPLNDAKNPTRMKIVDMEPKEREKNWAPFFDDDPSSINFVYSFEPLRILKCNLESGDCEKVEGPEIEANDAQPLRGGTNIVSVPSVFLPKGIAATRQYWFGIARSHILGCGCLKRVYRPHSFLISKEINTNNFTLDYVSSLMDFNINVDAWELGMDNAKCTDGKNVMIPSSIAFWDTIHKDNKEENRVSEDIMGLTFSEADRTTKVIHIKGFLKHIVEVVSGDLGKVKDHYSNRAVILRENELLGKCSISLADEYCKETEKQMQWT